MLISAFEAAVDFFCRRPTVDGKTEKGKNLLLGQQNDKIMKWNINELHKFKMKHLYFSGSIGKMRLLRLRYYQKLAQ